MLELLSKGGIIAIPILGCSVLVVAIFLERCITFTLGRRRGRDIESQVQGLVQEGQMEAALETARANNSPMGRVLNTAIESRDMETALRDTVMVNAVDQEVQNLSTRLQTLATIGNIAPILGLLGTIIGMIKAFMVIQQMGGKVNAAVLAGGIWEAMLTTALGLCVALPAMLAHSFLIARVDAQELRLQNGVVRFFTGLTGRAG